MDRRKTHSGRNGSLTEGTDEMSSFCDRWNLYTHPNRIMSSQELHAKNIPRIVEKLQLEINREEAAQENRIRLIQEASTTNTSSESYKWNSSLGYTCTRCSGTCYNQ